jgi:oxidoreductase
VSLSPRSMYLATSIEKVPSYRDVFCCLGTTKADAGSAEAFRKIDHDYVVNTAKLIAEENTGTEGGLSPVHFLYCSSAVS